MWGQGMQSRGSSSQSLLVRTVILIYIGSAFKNGIGPLHSHSACTSGDIQSNTVLVSLVELCIGGRHWKRLKKSKSFLKMIIVIRVLESLFWIQSFTALSLISVIYREYHDISPHNNSHPECINRNASM